MMLLPVVDRVRKSFRTQRVKIRGVSVRLREWGGWFMGGER